MPNDLHYFETIANKRKTTKVLSERDFPVSDVRSLVERVVSCAGSAPFHRACNPIHREDLATASSQPAGVEPWRFHLVDSQNCRKLRTVANNMENAGKIPSMLASAVAVAIATWLPNPPQTTVADEVRVGNSSRADCDEMREDAEYFEPTLENVEHIAAAAAAVQSLLLAATAAGLSSYWSSGGILRLPELLQRLGIPGNQRLLGVIFLFSDTIPDSHSAQMVGSKLRHSRGGFSHWSRWVELTIPCGTPPVPPLAESTD